jgi:hypothetical protein
MATAPSALARKLLVKPGHRLSLFNAPAGYRERLEPLPAGATVVETDGDGLDFVQLFVKDAGELERIGPSALRAVKPDGLLWICYPKGGVKAGTDLNRDILWQKVGEMGLAGVTLVAVDETWSAMRFRPPNRVGG